MTSTELDHEYFAELKSLYHMSGTDAQKGLQAFVSGMPDTQMEHPLDTLLSLIYLEMAASNQLDSGPDTLNAQDLSSIEDAACRVLMRLGQLHDGEKPIQPTREFLKELMTRKLG